MSLKKAKYAMQMALEWQAKAQSYLEEVNTSEKAENKKGGETKKTQKSYGKRRNS